MGKGGSMKEEARETLAELLGFHVGTPLDSGGTLRAKPVHCNEENCKKYKSECEYCITDAILALKEIAVVDMSAELPERTQICMRDIGLDKYIRIGYHAAQQDMLEKGWIKEVKNED